MKRSQWTQCDTCGDVSNSSPGLTCGRVDGDAEPCRGTYRPACIVAIREGSEGECRGCGIGTGCEGVQS